VQTSSHESVLWGWVRLKVHFIIVILSLSSFFSNVILLSLPQDLNCFSKSILKSSTLLRKKNSQVWQLCIYWILKIFFLIITLRICLIGAQFWILNDNGDDIYTIYRRLYSIIHSFHFCSPWSWLHKHEHVIFEHHACDRNFVWYYYVPVFYSHFFPFLNPFCMAQWCFKPFFHFYLAANCVQLF